MRAPNARPSGDTLHSRRWEGANLALLRRQYAKLPAERLEGLLALRVDELRDHCRQLGWTESKVASLTPDYAMPLIMYTKRFFEQSLRSIDLPKEGIVLPSDIVYHQAHLGFTPPKSLRDTAANSAGEGSEEPMQLLPVAKACKLGQGQRPRDARDPRRSNRVLHLC